MPRFVESCLGTRSVYCPSPQPQSLVIFDLGTVNFHVVEFCCLLHAYGDRGPNQHPQFAMLIFKLQLLDTLIPTTCPLRCFHIEPVYCGVLLIEYCKRIRQHRHPCALSLNSPSARQTAPLVTLTFSLCRGEVRLLTFSPLPSLLAPARVRALSDTFKKGKTRRNHHRKRQRQLMLLYPPAANRTTHPPRPPHPSLSPLPGRPQPTCGPLAAPLAHPCKVQ